MSNSPIEFLGERPGQRVPASEYGGVDGLLQPPPHRLTPSGANAAITRAGMYPDETMNEFIVDPVTGRVVDPSLITKG
jgi:hypothetical protein